MLSIFFLRRGFYSLIILLVMSSSLNAQNNSNMDSGEPSVGLVEMTSFRLVDGVQEQAFLATAQQMQKEFLNQQKGFISRILVKRENGQWTDLVSWTSKAALENAIEASQKSSAALPFFQMINLESVQMESGIPFFQSNKN